MTTVPELVPPRDPALATEWRERRRAERGLRPIPLAVALVTDGAEVSTATVLRAAGVQVVGLLGPEPLESLAWAAEEGVPRAYADLPALLTDLVEAVCVELPPPASDVVARAAARAGLHVLLARPLTAGSDVLMEVVEAAVDSDVVHVVALDGRAWPVAVHVRRAVPDLGRLSQLTVLDAPAGESGRAELVDLARSWCGEVLAVCADPAAMPAAELAPDAPVTLALLTASGATVLLAETAGATLGQARFTLTGEAGRFAFTGSTVRRQDATGVRALTLSGASGPRPGLTEAAYDVLRVVELAEPDAVHGATLGDLLSVAHVLDAAETSRELGGWVEL